MNSKLPYIHLTYEYNWTKSILSETYAKRSGKSWMLHVDQGLQILDKLTYSATPLKAFCIHPIVQNTKSFVENFYQLDNCDPLAVALAVEYRNVANKGSRHSPNWFPIELSCLMHVNTMLVADKVQNKFAYQNFTKSEDKNMEIDHYFDLWLDKLNISDEDYEELTKDLK